MDCVNHGGISATAYCQNCGKGLCPSCTRNTVGGQVLCAPCAATWQAYSQPFAPAFPGGPNPSTAAVLGLIPGVGAMYNGQFFKGFIHVVIFAVLITITTHYGIFGIFIAAWVIYQSFEAFHTAKAMRDGQPLPDPFGLNELSNMINMGARMHPPGQPGAGPGAVGGSYPPTYAGQPQPPFQAPYTPPVPGVAGPNAPPAPPQYWQPSFCERGEPIGAIVLIALGLMFLLGQLDIFHGHFMEFAWPLLLIALGVWLMVRRMGGPQGGSK
jgi:hypothetical protein